MNMFFTSILHNFFNDQLLESNITRDLKHTIVVCSRLNCKKKVNKKFHMHFFNAVFHLRSLLIYIFANSAESYITVSVTQL